MIDKETIAVYDRAAEDYAARFEDDGNDRYLSAFMAELPEAAKVLDIGCGPGRAAALMQGAGHTVLGIDASREMVRLAKKAGVNASCMPFDDMSTLAGPYDGVWANFALLHAPRNKMPDHLKSIAALLSAGGIFHIGMKTGTGSRRDSIGRQYSYYGEDELAQLITDAGFSELARSTGSGVGLDGIQASWVVLLSRRNA